MIIKPYHEGIEPDGVISGMPDTVYHATDGFISSSGLSVFNRSPAHYKYGAPKEKTRNMALGSALHCALLEPDIFKRDYMKLDGVKGRQAAAWKQAIKHRDEDYTLTEPESDYIALMQESVYAHQRASVILNTAKEKELSVFTQCPTTGVNVRVRIDILGGGSESGYAFDVKTTRDARDQAFSRSINDYRYHVQAALYMDAWEWETGEKLDGFKIVCVESDMPCSVMVYELDDIAIMLGRKAYQQDLINYAECLNTGNWGHYNDGTEDGLISLPEWVLRNELGE